MLLVCATFALPLSSPAQNLIWENQGMTNAFGINSGSTYAYNGATVTLTWFTNTVGSGSFVYGAYGSNFVTYQSGVEGAHTGHVLLGFDNSQDDPNDYISVTLSFSSAQSNLAFSILDIDQEGWDDGVDIVYNGSVNVFSNTSIWSYGQTNASLRTVIADNEGYFVGWEGDDDRANPDQNYGNLNLNFYSIPVTSVTIRFFSTDDLGTSNPTAQKIGISDLYVVPEPPALLAGTFLVLLLLLARRRLRR